MRKLIAAMKVSLDWKVTNADWVQAWSDDYSLMPEIDACVLGAGMYTGYEPYWTGRHIWCALNLPADIVRKSR